MAEAGHDNSTEWIWLGDYLEREFSRVHSVRLADRLTRRYLEERRLKCRYLDADGEPHSGSELPKGFWLEAEISREESAATLPPRPILSPNQIAMVEHFARKYRKIEAGMQVFRTGQPLPPSSPSAPAMHPAIEIFSVKVFVWRVGSTPREEPSEAAPVEPVEAVSTLAAPSAREPTPPEPKTKHARTYSVLAELAAKQQLGPGLQPREVRKVACPAYRKRYPEDKEPSPRVLTRAYQELYPPPTAK